MGIIAGLRTFGRASGLLDGRPHGEDLNKELGLCLVTLAEIGDRHQSLTDRELVRFHVERMAGPTFVSRGYAPITLDGRIRTLCA